MFRRKESEPTRLGQATPPAPAEQIYPPRSILDGKLQAELPRRAAEGVAPLVEPPRSQERTRDRNFNESTPTAEPAAEKQLIVGQGISLAGEITACDRLVVQGSVQVTLNQTRAIEIAEGGRFTNGRAEVEEADISGLYEGELTVKKRLVIRATGLVRGTVRYGELAIENGGRLTGSVALLGDAPAGAPSAAAPTTEGPTLLPSKAAQAA